MKQFKNDYYINKVTNQQYDLTLKQSEHLNCSCGSSNLSKKRIPSLFLDIPQHNYPVELKIVHYVYSCIACGKDFNENLPGMNQEHKLTNRLISSLDKQDTTLHDWITKYTTTSWLLQSLIDEAMCQRSKTVRAFSSSEAESRQRYGQ